MHAQMIAAGCVKERTARKQKQIHIQREVVVWRAEEGVAQKDYHSTDRVPSAETPLAEVGRQGADAAKGPAAEGYHLSGQPWVWHTQAVGARIALA